MFALNRLDQGSPTGIKPLPRLDTSAHSTSNTTSPSVPPRRQRTTPPPPSRSSIDEAERSRRRWSKPPLHVVSPRQLQSLDEADIPEDFQEDDEDDVVSNRNSKRDSQDVGALASALQQLKHNFSRTVREKESMQQYCEEMEKTVESREEMVGHLRSQNLLLSRKLGKSKDDQQNQVSALEAELEAEQDAASTARRRRKMLPQLPAGSPTRRLSNGTPELPQRTQKYKVAVLEEQIAELTKMNRELQDRFDESEAKIAETEKGHLQNAAACKAQIADAEARLLDEAMKAEMLLEEERLLTQRALETLEDDKVRLQDELDEMHSLLEELSADRTATAAAAAASEAAAQAAIAAARDAASTAVQDQEATSLSAELAQMGTAEEVTALRTKLDAADAENDQLKETQTALEAKAREVGALQTKLDAVDAEKAALEAKAREVGVLRSKLDAVDAEKAALEAKARELWSKLDAANAEKAALEARAREMGALHYKLDGLDAIEAECKAQAREVGALQTKLDAVDAEKAALEAKARELLAKLVEVDGENAALEARAREAGTLRTKLDAAAAEKGQLQNTKSALEAKVAEVVALTTQLNVARTENGRLEEGLNALEAKLTASEARATVAEAKAAEQLERAVAAEAKRRRAAAAESKLEQMSKRLAEADRKAKEYQAALVAAAAAAAAERQAAASKVAQLQSILHDDMADNEATLAAATAIMQRKIADAEANTKRLQERLDATADDQNATIEALETSNTSLQCELVEVKRTKFKGMTVSEQAAIFDQQVELKMELDEMHDELVVSKAAAAKAMWEKEHERLYQKSRNRILFNILSGPLSAVDREQVVQILMETEGTPDAAEGSDESGGSSGGDRGDTDGSTLPGSRTKIYDVAAPGGPSADAPAATRSMIDGKPVVALYLYAASHPDELDLMENEPLTILDAPNTDAGWITVQNAAGMQGVVPEAYVGPDDGMSAAGDGDGEDVDDFVVVKDNAGTRGAGAGAGVIVPEDAYGSSGVNYVLASASTSPPHPST